ncbi:MAG: alpha/beta hydrolase [Thermoplasmata archaeon]|nr:MAG: alpha/beta hydrolase [Thermoplasmata archaeon]
MVETFVYNLNHLRALYTARSISKMVTIYRTPEGETKIIELYDKILAELEIDFEETMIKTRFGETHIIITGPKKAPPLIILQGGNTVSPVTLSWFLPLLKKFRVYAPDTIGHPGKSSQNRISPKDESFGKWVADILDNLNLKKAAFIGPSYGAGIILRTATFAPERISKAVLFVPSGIATGSMGKMIFKIVFPMLMYRFRPTDKRLVKAVGPMFFGEIDRTSAEVTGAVFLNVKLETKMPKLTTKDELKNYKAPTMVMAGEFDVFFPAEKIIPRAKEVIPNLYSAECLKEQGHFPSRKNLKIINNKILRFLEEDKK